MEGKMKKNCISVILITLICSALLITINGCSNSEPSSSPTRISQSSPTIISQVSSSPVYARELFVFAAAGTKPAIDEASKLFEQKYGTKITVNYGGGGEVLSSMVIAKQGDLYIAPEQRFMDSAKKLGAVDSKATVASLAYMIPVIGVKKGNPQNIQSLADLAKPGIKVAMGNPETTALGIITPEILQKAALYEAVKKNIITNAPQVTAIITMLKMNQVDAGFIWHYFGTTSASDVDIIWIPREYVTGIGEIQAAVSTYSQESYTAEQFVNFLLSPEGKDIFKKNGYIVDSQEAAKYWLAN
jgi:molybdate transport system substrate-binding protein